MCTGTWAQKMFGELSQSDLAVCLSPLISSLKLTLKQYLTFFVVIIFDKNKNQFFEVVVKSAYTHQPLLEPKMRKSVKFAIL